jgi:hypothetical protein
MIIVVLVAAGAIWTVTPHNSPAHKLAVPVLIAAAAAAIIMIVLRVVAMWM